MITGRVNKDLEAMLIVSIYDAEGGLYEMEALLDTGYTGYLTLPAATITELGLKNFAAGQLRMADGSQVDSALYYATVIWDGEQRRVEVDALESQILVGMSMLEGFDLHIHVAKDGEATITSFR